MSDVLATVHVERADSNPGLVYFEIDTHPFFCFVGFKIEKVAVINLLQVSSK